jgi:pimeloyl-ACP methyl ester carboxylesterase
MKGFLSTSYGPIEYRQEGDGDIVVMLHGAHMNCDVAMGEQFLIDAGYNVLIPSRPGYGATSLLVGKTTLDFAKALKEGLMQLGSTKIILVGISAGGRSALQFAGEYPDMVSKLILQSAITHQPWPEPMTKLSAYIMFHPIVEEYTWALFRLMLREWPMHTLKTMLSNLTTLDPQAVWYYLTPQQRDVLVELLNQLRSGSGFLTDLKHEAGDLTRITAPTLVIHSKFDGSINLSHSEYVQQHVPHTQVVITEAESHLLWLSNHYVGLQQQMLDFLQTA